MSYGVSVEDRDEAWSSWLRSTNPLETSQTQNSSDRQRLTPPIPASLAPLRNLVTGLNEVQLPGRCLSGPSTPKQKQSTRLGRPSGLPLPLFASNSPLAQRSLQQPLGDFRNELMADTTCGPSRPVISPWTPPSGKKEPQNVAPGKVSRQTSLRRLFLPLSYPELTRDSNSAPWICCHDQHRQHRLELSHLTMANTAADHCNTELDRRSKLEAKPVRPVPINPQASARARPTAGEEPRLQSGEPPVLNQSRPEGARFWLLFTCACLSIFLSAVVRRLMPCSMPVTETSF